jgi:hypothetical protein
MDGVYVAPALPRLTVSAAATRQLENYGWPGNITVRARALRGVRRGGAEGKGA